MHSSAAKILSFFKCSMTSLVGSSSLPFVVVKKKAYRRHPLRSILPQFVDRLQDASLIPRGTAFRTGRTSRHNIAVKTRCLRMLLQMNALKSAGAVGCSARRIE